MYKYNINQKKELKYYNIKNGGSLSFFRSIMKSGKSAKNAADAAKKLKKAADAAKKVKKAADAAKKARKAADAAKKVKAAEKVADAAKKTRKGMSRTAKVAAAGGVAVIAVSADYIIMKDDLEKKQKEIIDICVKKCQGENLNEDKEKIFNEYYKDANCSDPNCQSCCKDKAPSTAELYIDKRGDDITDGCGITNIVCIIGKILEKLGIKIPTWLDIVLVSLLGCSIILFFQKFKSDAVNKGGSILVLLGILLYILVIRDSPDDDDGDDEVMVMTKKKNF